ncbi:MAG: hypothetical protein ABS54_12205 [Hyphomicrobium sp. SCN 65-11]|nr:MAG: hypothetical protein ABS54_12205 [Hyphomicrobium sp. SCN 65-11]
MVASLEGLKVLDLSRFIAGPYCAMLLGDLGAEVVKVEKPGSGEGTRQLDPKFQGGSLYATTLHRNKKSVVLDLRAPGDLKKLRDLAAVADVVVENFRPGTMEAMGCGWEELQALNPRLVMVRISGFGQTGPDAQKPCFDVIAQARSGIMDLTGDPDGPPTMAGVFICDYATGLYATIGTLAALQARERTGRGQVVEAALLDTGISFLMTALSEQLLFDRTTTRVGNRDRYAAPSNTFKSLDEDWVHIAGGGNIMFPRLAKAIGRPDLLSDPRFATVTARLANVDEIEAIVISWVKERRTADVLATLDAADVTCAKVATLRDVANDPQLRARGKIVDIEHEGIGTIPMQGLTIGLSDTPLAILSGIPRVGAHTEEILQSWLGKRA